MNERIGNVAVVQYQYSVVIKGIERKLKDMGFNVAELAGGYDEIRRNLDRSEIFIFYLPRQSIDDRVLLKDLVMICDLIQDRGREIFVIGEEIDHSKVVQMIPSLSKSRWYVRPVDVELLATDIEKAVTDMRAQSDRKRILIVDDTPSYAGMVREWLKDRYKVDIVTAGMQAITFLMKNPVDLILLDYEMPVVNGPQVFQMLRQEVTTKDIPVVFLTGVGTKEEVKKVMELKPDGYILKSTTKDQLLGYLSGLLTEQNPF